MSDGDDLAREFSQMAPDDQELVMALVRRLRRAEAPVADFPPDVAFMDFDE